MPTRRNYLSVVQDSRIRLQDNTPVNNFKAQATAKSIIDILALEIEKIYDDIEYVYKAIDPTKAVGSDLDKIGFLVGEKRSAASTASDYSNTNVFFYIDPRLNWNINTLIKRNYTKEEQDILVSNGYLTVSSLEEPTGITIPAGLEISNTNGSITYTTVESVTLTGQSDGYVGVVANGVGPEFNVGSNVLINHGLASIPELRKISNFIKSTNRFPIQNGTYSQSDEEFRYSIGTSKSAIRTNELSIKRAALSIPGVRDVLFLKNMYGNGTVNILIDGVTPLIGDGLIEAVSQKIQRELSYGDVIYVSKPEYLGVELQFNIVTEPTSSNTDFLRNEARERIIQYINDLPIGGQIVWNQIVSLVVDINGIIDIVPRIFKYGEYDSINKINKKQVILRFVNQQAKFDQKWYTDKGLITSCVA